jgi:hypothetical protein
MYPCHACKRHVRDSEIECPFCHSDLRSGQVCATPTIGAVALTAFVFLGSSACSREPSANESAGTTTSNESTDENSTTTDSETSEGPTTSLGTDTETETDTDDSSTLTTGSFYAPPEDISDFLGCDPWMQDCPEGEKCVPYASTGGNWNANKCVPITGDGQSGDPCLHGGVVEASDDCGPELHCWNVMNVEGQAIGTCTEFCQGDANEPQCPPDTSCLIAYDGAVNLCIATCDPLAQDCGPGLGCYWTMSEFNCVLTTSDIPVGEPCNFINDCIAGAACLSAELVPCAESACCASFCDLESNEPCPQPGTECSGFFEEGMAPPEYVNLGACVAP